MGHSLHMRKWLVLLAAFLILSTGIAQAFLFQIKPLDKAAIAKLTDEQLLDVYIDVMIELEAVNTFYNNAGIAPKEYEKYKTLLRLRTDLLIEIQKREIEVPRIK